MTIHANRLDKKAALESFVRRYILEQDFFVSLTEGISEALAGDFPADLPEDVIAIRLPFRTAFERCHSYKVRRKKDIEETLQKAICEWVKISMNVDNGPAVDCSVALNDVRTDDGTIDIDISLSYFG